LKHKSTEITEENWYRKRKKGKTLGAYSIIGGKERSASPVLEDKVIGVSPDASKDTSTVDALSIDESKQLDEMIKTVDLKVSFGIVCLFI
jgi:hypothetical protein